jgi:hypothetical protein
VQTHYGKGPSGATFSVPASINDNSPRRPSDLSCQQSRVASSRDLLGVRYAQSVLVLAEHPHVHVLIKDIDLCLGEVSCADLTLEKKI